MTYVAPFALPLGANPDLSAIKKALFVVAHPDDIDFGCSGTVAVLTAQGIDVSYCLITSGDAGGDNDGLTREQRIQMREREQTNAAEAVGVTRIHFLREADGYIEANIALREKICRILRIEKPDLVVTQSALRRYDRIFASHPDHLAAGEATISAVYPDSQNPNAFEHLLDEGLNAHKVKAVWVMADESPDTFIDITHVMDKKFAALFHHESQIADRTSTEAMVREWNATQAQEAGFSAGHFAESYRFVQIMY